MDRRVPSRRGWCVQSGSSFSGLQWTWSRWCLWTTLPVLDGAFWRSWTCRPSMAPIKAVENRPGRPTTDPQVLLALWLLATGQGIGSARRLARLCEEHDAYRWLRGHVPINYHMLSDFRVAHQEALDDLLTQIIGSLMAAGAVTLERVAQDGMRVRAGAGPASFRGKGRLEACLDKARAQVERLAQEREHPDPGVTRREQGAPGARHTRARGSGSSKRWSTCLRHKLRRTASGAPKRLSCVPR